MHNCKSARSSFIDLALDEMPPDMSRQVLAELSTCRACREEFAVLKSTLHVSNQGLRSALPGEDFWPGYQARLRQSLLAGVAQESEHPAAKQPTGTPNSMWLSLVAMLTTSVRVPIPAAVAVMILFVMAAIGLRSREQVNTIPKTAPAIVETRTVTVPVVQEKVITRVVYVDRKPSRLRREQLSPGAQPINPDGLASAASVRSSKTALNLAGFEPTDQVRLTVIKGSYRDEK